MEGHKIKKLVSSMMDLSGIRTVSYIENLARFTKVKKLMHPLISGPAMEDLEES